MAKRPASNRMAALIKNQEKAATAPKEHLNAKIDKDLKRRMKIHCAEKGISMQDFLTEAIQTKLQKEGE